MFSRGLYAIPVKPLFPAEKFIVIGLKALTKRSYRSKIDRYLLPVKLFLIQHSYSEFECLNAVLGEGTSTRPPGKEEGRTAKTAG